MTDEQARLLAQTEFSRPILIEAGAGTGKTATLVARIVAWAVGPGWEQHAQQTDDPARQILSRIVPITFTEAAAAEMAERTSLAFQVVADGGAPPGLNPGVIPPEGPKRARALAHASDHLVVRTIHAWCRSLLASWPLEAKLHPHFEVDAQGHLLAATIEDVVLDAIAEGLPEPWMPLVKQGIGPSEVAQMVRVLAEAGVTQPELGTDEEALWQRVWGDLRELDDAVGDSLEFAPRVGVAQDVLLTVRRALDEEPGRDAIAPMLDPRLTARLAGWGRVRFTHAEAEVMGPATLAVAQVADRLVVRLRHVDRLNPVLLGAVGAVVQPLLTQVWDRMRRQGAMTFQGLLAGAAHLVAHHPEVATAVRDNIDLLLVDEFQDTDALQCDLVRTLGLHTQGPSLFVVGDPKQSIYAWRSADLRAYEGFAHELKAMGGICAVLAVNYRSVPAILDEVAAIVSQAMTPVPGIQPMFRGLEPCAGKRDDPGVRVDEWHPVEHWLIEDEEGEALSGVEALEIEARAIALDIDRLHTQHATPFSSFAVLLRSTTDIDPILTALRERGIPYDVSRDRSYYRRREVMDTAALLRVILDPTDQVALVTWLRSAWVGVPDAALVDLWGQGFPQHMADLSVGDPDAGAPSEAVAKEVAGHAPWGLTLQHGLHGVAAARQAFAEQGPRALFRVIRGQITVELTESARYLGAYRIGNVQALLATAEAALVAGGGDVHTVLSALRRAVKEAQEAPDGIAVDAFEDAVQVMTIHRSKGLGFSQVYLPQVHKESRARGVPRNHVAQVGGIQALNLVGIPTPNMDLAQLAEREVEAAERVRLLYVALTRAKARLVVSGSPMSGQMSVRPKSLRELVEMRQPAPNLVSREKAAGGRHVVDLEDLRVCFPGRWEIPDPRPASSPTDEGLSSTVHEDLARITAMKERWATTRPLVAPVTATTKKQTTPPEPSADGPEDARDAGIFVHKVLELMDHGTSLEARLQMARTHLADAELPSGAQGRVHRVFEALECGVLLGRLGDWVARGARIAREVPLVLPGGDNAQWARTGAIDLLVCDAGQWLVVDYKTGGSDASQYLEQAQPYVEAVAQALAVPSPQFEIWFLHQDRAVPLAMT